MDSHILLILINLFTHQKTFIMKKNIFSGMLLLCLFLVASADKIDKKGNILNSNCNPIGSRCGTTTKAEEVNYSFAYNEPRQGSFSMQFTQDAVLQNQQLKQLLVGKSQFVMEEDMPIDADVIETLRMPQHYIVKKGSYPVEFKNGVYSVIFVR